VLAGVRISVLVGSTLGIVGVASWYGGFGNGRLWYGSVLRILSGFSAV
jgi:hypothetical protein